MCLNFCHLHRSYFSPSPQWTLSVCPGLYPCFPREQVDVLGHTVNIQLLPEMMKAGLIEEMMDDVMDSVHDTQEEEVDEEVQKVLLEVAGDEIAELPDAGVTKVEPAQTEEVRSLPDDTLNLIHVHLVVKH